MIDRTKAIRAARWGVAGAIVLAVGAAGAATKLKRSSSTGDACLCTPDTQAPTDDAAAALDPSRASTSYLARNGAIPSSGTSNAGPLVGQPLGDAALNHDGAGAGGGWRSGFAGWGNGARSIGAYSSSSGSGRGAALGGLWRLMNLSRRRGASEPAHVIARASRPSASRPPRTVSPRPPSGSTGGSGGGSLTAPVTTPVAGDLFGENTTSIPDLLNPGSAAPGAGAGASLPGRGGASVGDPGSLAATPEPGSLLLLGTGLIGVAGLLRRRITA